MSEANRKLLSCENCSTTEETTVILVAYSGDQSCVDCLAMLLAFPEVPDWEFKQKLVDEYNMDMIRRLNFESSKNRSHTS